jgi:hypothetical protein
MSRASERAASEYKSDAMAALDTLLFGRENGDPRGSPRGLPRTRSMSSRRRRARRTSSAVLNYLEVPGMGRKGMTDVLTINSPIVVLVNYVIRVYVFPGWDPVATMNGQPDERLAVDAQSLVA